MNAPLSPLSPRSFADTDYGRIEYLDRGQGAPVLVVHGSDDRLVPPALGRQLFDAAAEPKRFVLVEGGSHHNTNSVGLDQYRAALPALFGDGCWGAAAPLTAAASG